MLLWLEFSVSEDFKSIHFFTTICSFYVGSVTHHQPKKGLSLAPPLRDTFILYCIRRKFNLLPARVTVEAKKKTHFCLFLQQWEEFILYSRFSPSLLRSRSSSDCFFFNSDLFYQQTITCSTKHVGRQHFAVKIGHLYLKC